MITNRVFLFAGVIGVMVLIVQSLAADKGRPSGEDEFVVSLDKLVRVTHEPRRMQPNTAAACAPAVRNPDHSSLVRQPAAVIHVYVSPEGVAAMNKRDATPFPAGTLIVKQKFADNTAQRVVLYTGMRKQAEGYNPECGDWEFFTLSGDGKSVTSRGRLESCMACHKEYARTDYVTKKYPVER